MQRIFILLATVVLHISSNAQTNQSTDQPIKIKALMISVKADLFSARTIMDVELFNPNSKVLDGELDFSLHEDQVVTGFALDINGKMRDGVIVEKQKARVAYENTIRRKVDPGLLESTDGNNYRVRVYPMPASGSRKISITIHQNLIGRENRLDYFLPLQFKNHVDRFSADIEVYNSILSPYVEQGLLEGQSFGLQEGSFHLHFGKTNLFLEKPLSFSILLEEEGTTICVDDSNYFVARTKVFPIEENKTPVDRVTIFWDVSSSADKRDISKEIQFIDSYLKNFSPNWLQIVCFSNDIQETRLFADPTKKFSSIKNYLEDQVHDGGTRLNALACSNYPADEFLLFSDGINNFGSDQILLSGKPVYCISSASSSNPFLLQHIAAESGGKYINMQNMTAKEAIQSFKEGEWQFVKAEYSDSIDKAVVSIANGYLTVAGRSQKKNGSIAVALRSGVVQKIETIPINESKNCGFSGLSNYWALAKLAKLRNEYNSDERQTAEFAKEQRLVTPNTSLIVLDNLDDYFQYDITPPKDLLDEYYRRYYVKQQRDQEKKTDQANEKLNLLKATASAYNKRIAWWGKELPAINFSGIESKKETVTVYQNEAVPNQNNTINGEGILEGNLSGLVKANDLDEVVVIGYGSQRRRSVTGAVTSVSSSELSYAHTIAEALQGRVAGVQVFNYTGQPGNIADIKIRGTSSFDSSRQPLYVLDGMPVDASDALLLNTNDIDNITVLKDASATSLYGSRGANGVIVITSKRPQPNRQPIGIPKYKDLDDIDYIEELKNIDLTQKYQKYLEMKKTGLGLNASFYFDVADHLFNEGLMSQAIRVLTNLAEMQSENHQLLRAMGYMLETWKEYENAIDVYKKVLSIKEEEPQSYRDLALAYEKQGNHQKAVDILYQVLTKDWQWYESRYNGLRGIILNELNSIIELNGGKIDISKIAPEIIKPLPVDLRIVIDWNKDETDIDLHVVEPGGEECYYSHNETKKGGRISEDFTQGYGPEEYEIKNAGNGLYKIRVNYYGDRYQKQQVPSFIKVTIYRNYGKENQSMSVQNLIMDGQSGMIEIADVKF